MLDKVIYRIINVANGKIYIGQTSDIKDRIRHYRYAAKSNSKVSRQPLIVALRKHGFENFVFDILGSYNTFVELDAAEMYFIKKYNSTDPDIGYNRSPGGKAKRCHRTANASIVEPEKSNKSIIVFKNNVFKIYPSAKAYASEVGCDRSIITVAMRKGGKYKNALFYYRDTKKRNEFMLKNRNKVRYCEIGRVINNIGINNIDGVIFLTRELRKREG